MHDARNGVTSETIDRAAAEAGIEAEEAARTGTDAPEARNGRCCIGALYGPEASRTDVAAHNRPGACGPRQPACP